MKLRDYQQAIIHEIRHWIRMGKSKILVQSPTGSGKTAMLAFMVGRAAGKGKRPLFTVPAREILIQAIRSLSSQEIDHGIIAAGFSPDPNQPVQIATIQTLARRIHAMRPPDFVVVDECHHAPAKQWRKLWEVWPDTVFIGLTATPWRLDGSGLGDQFEIMITGPSVRHLIDAGHLCDYVVYAPPVGMDISGIQSRAGDFDNKSLADMADRPTITGNAIQHYQRIAPGKRAVVAAVNIGHSKNITAQFRAAGIPAVHIDGSEDERIRDRIMADFTQGRIRILSQVGIINEGVDIPGIEAVISLRPTQSLSLWLQFVGRALRPAPGKKKAIILDHAGNTHRHGLPCDEREWSLDGAKKKGPSHPKTLPVRQCPHCFACHAPRPVCPSCGHVYKIQERHVEQVDGELKAVDQEKIRRVRRKEVAQAKSLEELQAIGRQRGYKQGWAHHVWAARQHKWGSGHEHIP
ncbi:MAG: DEAD/DEAH box helicase family protein [Magnetococcales bacterium]|nr:DEAD/DEAH box helicase family protein [Magnetococcales bacterium]